MSRRYANDSSDDDSFHAARAWSDPDEDYFGGDDGDKKLEDLNPDDLPAGWKIPSRLLELIIERKEEKSLERVSFLRPEGWLEGKDVAWCLENGFWEVEKGLWSGSWYWEERGEQPPPANATPKTDWENTGLMSRVNDATFGAVLTIKAVANEHFAQGEYGKAIKLYDQALKMLPLPSFVMPTNQLDEMVKIYSNKAESLLRLNRNVEAGMAANDALILDASHEKSRFRRAKASWQSLLEDRNTAGRDLNFMALAQAEEDLQDVIQADGPGKADAQALLDELNAELRRDAETFPIDERDAAFWNARFTR